MRRRGGMYQARCKQLSGRKGRERESLSTPHATLSLPTTVTYVFISEILSFFAGTSTSTLPESAGVFERPFSRARNQTALFFPIPLL